VGAHQLQLLYCTAAVLHGCCTVRLLCCAAAQCDCISCLQGCCGIQHQGSKKPGHGQVLC
jgi:hypothetical protein